MPVLPQDKANHFFYGTLIYLIASLLLHGRDWGKMAALGVVVSAGILKELADRYSNQQAGKQVHEVSIMDTLATAAGGLVCFLSGIV